MRIAVCPGSFDPITKGHIDIISRATKLFDRVVVAVSVNPAKHGSFSLDERVELIKMCTTHLENVEIDVVTDLLADYSKRVGACAIVKGLRAVTDFEYEFQMALANKKLNPEAETVFLTTATENMYLSSSLVKQIASFGGDISDFVPTEINDIVAKRLYQIKNDIGG
ncbi:pantetheine-phosphate adenylyltransferase [Paludicola sp. MB14-C6]|uniref:pantetheine-phosphate adenylyltransferase n=1 Tax=Paludihabitans sp. MB14-C6 TaxID=3070656 RepID=UPI0027DE4E52|nr:pantetheine-phosphate adenylyltransferase [Paludicola sp. MB14-C6]WMJ23606.1 pantetheine-phosphate adenylyltransferase [Paludicola sp. MB14-C6]